MSAFAGMLAEKGLKGKFYVEGWLYEQTMK